MILASRWVLMVGFAVTLLAPGCGDTSKDDAGTGGMPGSGGSSTSSGGSGRTSGLPGVDDFQRSLWQAFCQQLFRCTSANDDDIGSKAALGSEQRCLEMVAQIEARDPRQRDLNEKLASSAVRFVPALAPLCLEEARSCGLAKRSSLSRSGPACRAVFEGSVKLGGDCQRDEECVADARCAIDLACPGKCVARAAAGERCNTASDCDDAGGYMLCRADAASGNLVCTRVAIATAAKLGEPCTAALGEGTSFIPCANGLWCDGPPGTSPSVGTCRAPLADGAACDDDDDLCVDGDSCFDLTSCKPLQFGARPGDACADEAGPFCDPFARLSCVSGKCQTLGDGELGGACATSDINEVLDCKPGLYCSGSGTAATCATLLAAGAACQANAECVSGTCESGTCATTYCDR